jgi:hypothetical protein
MREAAGDGERAPSHARASAGSRSVKMGLDVGRVSFDLQNDVRSEEESCIRGGTTLIANEEWVDQFSLTRGVHREKVISRQFCFTVEFIDSGSDRVIVGVYQTCESYRSWADAAKRKFEPVSGFGE